MRAKFKKRMLASARIIQGSRAKDGINYFREQVKSISIAPEIFIDGDNYLNELNKIIAIDKKCSTNNVNYQGDFNMSQHPEERSKSTSVKSKSSDSDASKSGKGSAGQVEKKGGKSTPVPK